MFQLIDQKKVEWEDFPEVFRSNPFFVKEKLVEFGEVVSGRWPIFEAVEEDCPVPSDKDDSDDSDSDVSSATAKLMDRKGNLNSLTEGMRALSRDPRFNNIPDENLRNWDQKLKQLFNELASMMV